MPLPVCVAVRVLVWFSGRGYVNRRAVSVSGCDRECGPCLQVRGVHTAEGAQGSTETPRACVCLQSHAVVGGQGTVCVVDYRRLLLATSTSQHATAANNNNIKKSSLFVSPVLLSLPRLVCVGQRLQLISYIESSSLAHIETEATVSAFLAELPAELTLEERQQLLDLRPSFAAAAHAVRQPPGSRIQLAAWNLHVALSVG